MPKETKGTPPNPAAAQVAGMAAPFPQATGAASATEGGAKPSETDGGTKPPDAPPGAPAPGLGGELGSHAAGEAGDTKGSAGDVAGPASLGNRDNANASDAPPPAATALKPDATVAIVPAVAPVVEVLPSGMPKHIESEVKDKRHWIYKRNAAAGQFAKFWRTDRPGHPKPVLMRNATQTWDGTEAEFKDQFERD